mgnify:CR=1 FL=1|tara:strand:+ start:86 stop:1552 length:1467 start_codon:yes stop_codon:yes gene_type:complete
MPNWKKVIVSGSNAVLNNISASGDITASGNIYSKKYFVDDIQALDTADSTLTGKLFANSSTTRIIVGKSGTNTITELTGNVGIGTTNPSEPLQVTGNVSASGAIVGDTLNLFSSTLATGIQFNGAVGGQLDLIQSDGSSLDKFYIKADEVQIPGLLSANGDVQLGNDDFAFSDKITIIGHLTASSNISASGHLFFSASENSSTSYKTLVIDPTTGKVFRTGSYGGGGGGASGIFVQTGSFYATTNDLQITGSTVIESTFESGDTDSTVLKLAGSGSVSGSGLFDVDGSTGTLFAVVDDGLDDVIFAANNISGTPVIEANADNTVKLGKLNGFGIVISGSTPAPSNIALANILMTGSVSISGSMGVGMSATTTFGRIDAKNDVVAFSTSDERLKKYVKNIPNALDKVSQINGVNFQWRKTDEEVKQNVHSFEGKDVGVIAQEIEKVLPEVVITRDNGYKAVKYEKIIPLLIESIKELKAEIEELKKSRI